MTSYFDEVRSLRQAAVARMFSPRFIDAWMKTVASTHERPRSLLFEAAVLVFSNNGHMITREILERFASIGDTPHPEVLDTLRNTFGFWNNLLGRDWPELITQVFTEIALMQQEEKTP